MPFHGIILIEYILYFTGRQKHGTNQYLRNTGNHRADLTGNDARVYRCFRAP